MARSRPPRPPANLPAPAPDPEDRPLNDDEREFLNQWAIDHNATAAYLRFRPGCSYRTAYEMSGNYMARPHVRAERKALLKAQEIRLQLSADAVLKEIRRVAGSDIAAYYHPTERRLLSPHEIPLDARRAVQSIKATRTRRKITVSGRTRIEEVEEVVEYKLWSKLDALDKLARHLGLKSELAPLDVVLALLPPDLADEVRGHLSAASTAARAPRRLR